MDDLRKDIVFITDASPAALELGKRPLFKIKDGESIKCTSGFDGNVTTYKCRWLDETHFSANGECFHRDQIYEICKRNGNTLEPIAAPEPTLDILAAKYGEDMKAAEIPMTDAAIKELVGGDYEVTPLRYQSGKVCAALVRGADGIAVCGIGKGDALTSLHPYTAQTYKRELSPAEPSRVDAVCAENRNRKERGYER